MPIPISPEQRAFFENNNTKNASLATWHTFTISHPDWTEEINLCGLVNDQPVEKDDGFYVFEGVTYRPISMSIEKANESSDDNGQMSIVFSRAGSEVKKRMREITPENSRVPKSFIFRQYQEGTELPVISQDFTIAIDYPKISGSDVKIVASSYNPNNLTSSNIATTSLCPELRFS